MKALIIEDEIPAQMVLERLLAQHCPQVRVIGRTGSITGAVEWLSSNSADVIFMDVELSDGLCFEIFRMTDVRAKVIITTAYDNYAIKAFKVNSIDYLLKPIDSAELVAAVRKCNTEAQRVGIDASLAERIIGARLMAAWKERFTVNIGDRIKVVETRNIAYFVSEEKSTYIVTTDAQNYIIDLPLDHIEGLVDPVSFFRVSRGCIASLDAIRSINRHFNGRLKLIMHPPLPEPIVVSRQRADALLRWLEGEVAEK